MAIGGTLTPERFPHAAKRFGLDEIRRLARVLFQQGARDRTTRAGLDLLASDVMGLSLDQDQHLRRDMARLMTDGFLEEGAYHSDHWGDSRELTFAFSDGPSPELVRTALRGVDEKVRHKAHVTRYSAPGDFYEVAGVLWEAATQKASAALRDESAPSALLPGEDGKHYVVTTMRPDLFATTRLV